MIFQSRLRKAIPLRKRAASNYAAVQSELRRVTLIDSFPRLLPEDLALEDVPFLDAELDEVLNQ